MNCLTHDFPTSYTPEPPRLGELLDTLLPVALIAVAFGYGVVEVCQLNEAEKLRLGQLPMTEKVALLDKGSAYVECPDRPVWPPLWQNSSDRAHLTQLLSNGTCMVMPGPVPSWQNVL